LRNYSDRMEAGREESALDIQFAGLPGAVRTTDPSRDP